MMITMTKRCEFHEYKPIIRTIFAAIGIVSFILVYGFFLAFIYLLLLNRRTTRIPETISDRRSV